MLCAVYFVPYFSLFEIIQSLYFSIYGLVDLSHFRLREPHRFTEFVGKTIFGMYMSIMTLVLINMFIAMLSSSYQKIIVSVHLLLPLPLPHLQRLYYTILYYITDISSPPLLPVSYILLSPIIFILCLCQSLNQLQCFIIFHKLVYSVLEFSTYYLLAQNIISWGLYQFSG